MLHLERSNIGEKKEYQVKNNKERNKGEWNQEYWKVSRVTDMQKSG